MKIFIDSNIFIYAIEDEGKLGEESRKILHKNTSFVTSVITINEVLTGVYRKKNEDKIPLYLEYISGRGRITIWDINKEIAILAAEIRAIYKLKAPDSIQIATALKAQANLFVTADRRIPKNIGNLKIKVI